MRDMSGTSTEQVRAGDDTATQRKFYSMLLATTAMVSVAAMTNVALAQDSRSEVTSGSDQTDTEAGSAGAGPSERRNDEVLEEVVITARRIRAAEQTTATGLSLSLIETPQAMSVLSEETFHLVGADNLYEALELVPGGVQSGSGWGRDGIIIRGARIGTPRVNGTRFPLQTSLEQDAFERVEIVRGPATGMYGTTGSFTGEINHVLKKPSEDFGGMLEAKAGSFDYTRVAADITGPVPGTDERLQVRLVGAYQDWGRPQKVVDIQNDKYMAMAAVSYDFSDRTEANFYYYDSSARIDPYDGSAMVFRDGTLDVPDVPWDNYYFSDPRNSIADVDYTFTIADVIHQLDNEWQLKGQVTRQESGFDGSYYYPFGPAGAYGLGENEVYFYTFDASRNFDRLTLNASLGGEFELFGNRHQFFTGIEFYSDIDPDYQQIKQSIGLGFLNIYEGGQGVLSNGEPIPLIDRDALPISRAWETETSEVRATAQIMFNATDRLHILGGVIFDSGDSDMRVLIGSGEDISDDYSDFFGRMAVTYDLLSDHGVISDLKLYGSFSETSFPNTGVRDPDGNFISEPQVMQAYELGLKSEINDGAFGITIAAFDQEIKNIPIFAGFLGDLFSGSVPGGTKSISGVELELIGEIIPGWNAAINYAYTDTSQTDPNFGSTDVRAKMISRHQAALITSYEWQTGPLAGFRIGAGIVNKSSYRLTDAPRTIALYGNYTNPGYTRFDFNASYIWGNLEIFANIENATDEAYFVTWEAHPGFGIQRGEPRTFRGGIRYRF